ncbi:uncharacterized protein Dmoj_GI26735 [Drosophila mojavensis]|uniref:Thioredoxin domain-containing protein n=1 Tax=Drosophila mojavensis TaxID=7230 RepID=A0A0Q9XJ88_DROMO|nr:uncharacterized protein Dmoj_GI26735 [Drosophila mojavensis]
MTFTRIKTLTLLVCTLLALSFPGYVNCANKKGSQPAAAAAAAAAPPLEPEAVIEEVNAKQLEKLLADKDYVAVFWYARSCVTCDKVLAELEKIDDDTDSFGVDFVKINDKRLAKQYGIKTFPALTYFREKEPIIYDGDLMDEEGVLDFLTSLEAMDLPDRIEEVNAKILQKIIEDTDFVAVLFYKQQCRKCAKALQELENIDDEADQLGIGFVKIHDEALADEYNLGNLPVLVYYRHQTPIIYEGELQREEDVLEWLVQNKSTGDEDDVIEDVTSKTLSTLISNIDNLVVLFYDHGNDDSMTVLEELEQIDDDCDKHGIQFVKIDDAKAAADYGIDSIPAIVYFEKEIPNVYDGDLMDEEQILKWLLGQLEHDEIEDVTDEMLDTMIKEGRVIAVLFYDNNDKKSQKVLEELENIDDECDALGITFVKIDNPEEAVEYGINKVPKLIYFEKGIPTIYEGNLEDEEKLLKWLEEQTSSDQIEDITDEMLDLIIEKMPHVAVLFYDKDQKKSQKILAELENIDDECDQNDIAFVKIDDDKEAKEWGIDEIPSIVLFERGIPHIYEGDLMKEDELLGWLVHQKRYSEIPEVTDEMKDKLVENTEHLAVIFYDKDDKQDMRILNELENIDDELEKEGIEDDNDNDNDDDDDDDKDNDNDDEEEDISKQVYKHRAKGRTIHRLSDLCSGHVIDEIDLGKRITRNAFHKDDECFYVGLGHDGHSAKRGNSYVPNDYKPFQCCPTKLEKSTKVPKMTAQRIGHSDGESSKRQGGNFKFASTTNQKPSSQTPSKPKPNANAQKPTQKRKVINNNDDDDDDNDDDDDDDDDVPLVKVSYANKRSGQSNKKPLNKVQDLDDESVEVEKPKKSSKKSGNKLNVKTGYLSVGVRQQY